MHHLEIYLPRNKMDGGATINNEEARKGRVQKSLIISMENYQFFLTIYDLQHFEKQQN